MASDDTFIPALGHKRLTGLYDPLLKWVMQEGRFKRALVEQIAIAGKQSVLDLGCGTGTLTLMLKQRYPLAHLDGLDGDEAVLKIARLKAQRAGVSIEFERGMAYSLPYATASFDRVVSSLMFHHLVLEDKKRAAREIRRVLKPDGVCYIADLGKPRNWLAAIPSILIRRMEHADDNVQGRLGGIFQEAGFRSVRETHTFNTVVGTLQILEMQI